MRTVKDFAIAKAFEIGDGTHLDEQAFKDSDAAGDSTYVPAGVYHFGTNVALSNQLAFEQGATLKPSRGVTLTLNGDISAGLWQIFDLSAGGSIVLNGVSEVQARWFGAHPTATGATNAAAINKAIVCAKASRNATLVLGPGTLEIDATLSYSGGQGIPTIGTLEGELSRGCAPGNCVLKWVGGASAMVDVSDTFNTFHGFSLQNNGNGTSVATHGIRCSVGGRQWMDRLIFSCPVGASAFSVASIELGSVSSGVNYDRINRCEFEAGPALKVLGAGTTLLVDGFMMDSTVGSGAFIDIQGGLDVLTIRNGTMNYPTGTAMRTLIDMSNIGSDRVSVCHVENNEFDGSTTAQQFIAKVKNCDAFLFETNQVSGFGNPSNTESPITATDSRVTLRNNVGYSINRPLVRTLDTTSFVYSYESRQELGNTNGYIEANSQSGNLISAVVSGADITIQGDRASAMAHSVHVATLITSGTAYTVDVAQVTDSFNKGFMTKGQVFTIVFFNNSGADPGALNFNSTRFVVEHPLPAPPPAGKRLAMTFVWDGASARELMRQYDQNPTWVAKASSATLSLGERRIAADAGRGNITITLPRADTAQMGARFLVKKMTAANTVTINSTGGFTIDGASSYALSKQWSVVELESDGTQWLVI